jgi:hypothetical protein
MRVLDDRIGQQGRMPVIVAREKAASELLFSQCGIPTADSKISFKNSTSSFRSDRRDKASDHSRHRCVIDGREFADLREKVMMDFDADEKNRLCRFCASAFSFRGFTL